MTIILSVLFIFAIYVKRKNGKKDMGILIDGLINGETSATVVTEKYFKESAYSGTYTLDFTGEKYNKALNYDEAYAGGVGVNLYSPEAKQVMRFCDVNEFCPLIALNYLVVDPTLTVTGGTGPGGVYGSAYKWYYLKLERLSTIYYPLKLEFGFSNVPTSGSPYHPVQQYTGDGTLYAGLYFFSGTTGMQTPSTSYAVNYLNITETDNSNGNGRVLTARQISNFYFSIYHSDTWLTDADIGVILNGESGITVTYGGSASTQTNDSQSAMRFYYTSSGTHSFSGQNEWAISVFLTSATTVWGINTTDENYKGKVVKSRNNLCRNGSKTADIYPIFVDAYLRPAFWAKCETLFTVKIIFYLQKTPGTSGGLGMAVRTYTGSTTSDLSLVNNVYVSLDAATSYKSQEIFVYEGNVSPNVYKVTFTPVNTMTGTIGWTFGTYSQSLAWSPDAQTVTTSDVGTELPFVSVGNGNMSTGTWVNEFNANVGY